MAKPVVKFLTDSLTIKDRQLKGFAASFPAEGERISVPADFVKAVIQGNNVAGLMDGTILLDESQLKDLVSKKGLIYLERAENPTAPVPSPEGLLVRGNIYGRPEHPLFFRDPLVRFGLNKWFFPGRGQSLKQLFFWGSLEISGPYGSKTFGSVLSWLKNLKVSDEQVSHFSDFYNNIDFWAKSARVDLQGMVLRSDGIRMGLSIEGRQQADLSDVRSLFQNWGKPSQSSLVVNLTEAKNFELMQIYQLTRDRGEREEVGNNYHYYFIG